MILHLEKGAPLSFNPAPGSVSYTEGFFFPILEGQQGKVAEILCTKKIFGRVTQPIPLLCGVTVKTQSSLKDPLKMVEKYCSKVFSASNCPRKSF